VTADLPLGQPIGEDSFYAAFPAGIASDDLASRNAMNERLDGRRWEKLNEREAFSAKMQV